LNGSWHSCLRRKLRKALAHQIAHVAARDLALHVERVDRGPERFAILDQLLVEIVGDRAAALALRPHADALMHADLHREILGTDHLRAAGDDQALDDVFQLADVARPRVVAQQLGRVGGNLPHRRAVVLHEPLEEGVDQERDVLAALAQRRHRQVDDVQAIEQILAERAFGNHVAKVPVGGGDDADIDASHRAIRADLLDFAGLHEAQQQPLHAQRHFRDFVEEHRAAIGDLELALLVAICAGEAAFDVAEQLRFEQCLGQTRAVHRHHRATDPGAARVDGVSHQFLANAALASDQHFRIGFRHAVDFLCQLEDDTAGPDQLSVVIAFHVHTASSIIKVGDRAPSGSDVSEPLPPP
jgi:hypothetical protein